MTTSSKEKKRCRICGRSKPLDDFYRNKNTKDGRASYCKLCQDGYHEQWRADPTNLEAARTRARNAYHDNRTTHHKRVALAQTNAKLKAMAILGGKCQRCPEDHPAALQFHHRDPSTKLFSVSTKTLAMAKKYPWDMIEAEVAKCDLLCANCHAKLHSVLVNEGGEWIVSIKEVNEKIQVERDRIGCFTPKGHEWLQVQQRNSGLIE